MKQFDINQFKHGTAPYQPQSDYVDDLVTRATRRALDREGARQAPSRHFALIAAAAVTAIAVTLAIALFNTGGDNATTGEKVAIASSTPDKTEAQATVANVTPNEKTRAMPAAQGATPPAQTVKATTTGNLDDYDDLDSFLNTLNDDELIAIDDTYIDEIPEY